MSINMTIGRIEILPTDIQTSNVENKLIPLIGLIVASLSGTTITSAEVFAPTHALLFKENTIEKYFVMNN